MNYKSYIENRAEDRAGAEAYAIITGGNAPDLDEARQIHEAIGAATEDMTDATASKCAALFPTLKQDGSLVEAGKRINWKGEVMKNGAALWDREENDPDHAPTLWETLPYRDGIRIIPETITVTTLFHKDELGWWGDMLYRSKVDNNAYNPDQYPPNWEVV